MLAYVFWHWPETNISEEEYVQRLIAFHQTLNSNKPDGFISSTVFRIRKFDWLGTNGAAFEDWYLVNDSAGLDVINHAAISGVCERPHNQVARHAAGGIAGLYRLKAGVIAHSKAKKAYWFPKTPGVSYPDFLESLGGVTAEGDVGLWCRQMTLGPTKEFALYTAKPLPLPSSIEFKEIEVNHLWSDR